jgi:hypothetical protein
VAANVTEHERFDLPAVQVFDYLVDFSNLAEWDPMFDRSRRIEGEGQVEVGHRFEVVAEKAGTELPITYTVEECDRPNRAKLVGRGDGFTSIDEIEVTSLDDGCELTWNATVETDAPAVDTLATPAFKGVAKSSMHGLRETLGQN